MCITPFKKTNTEHGIFIEVPCGKCPECLKRRASGWSFRLRKEEEKHISARFITLTYDAEHVPISDNGFMTLDVKDVQDFFKRLRRLHEIRDKNHPKIRYYVAGEYGGENMRPHYHIIMFNAIDTLVESAWHFPARMGKKISQVRLDKSAKVPSFAGYIDYGTVTGASIGYTLKYMCKPPKVPVHQRDDRVPEFSLMSKGLGNNYITPAMVKWHKKDLENRMYIVIEDGKKISMPRYFKDKIYSDRERLQIKWHAIVKNQEIAEKKEQEYIAKYGQDEYIRMRVESHINSFKKMYNDAEKNRNKI